jgi:hypothetical protein
MTGLEHVFLITGIIVWFLVAIAGAWFAIAALIFVLFGRSAARADRRPLRVVSGPSPQRVAQSVRRAQEHAERVAR